MKNKKEYKKFIKGLVETKNTILIDESWNYEEEEDKYRYTRSKNERH